MRFLAISLILFLSNCPLIFAQSSGDRFTGTISDGDLDDLVEWVESESDYRFFFDSSQFDSLSVNISAQNLPIQQVLQIAFENSEFHFSIGNNKHIIITKGIKIVSSLPYGFFDVNSDAPINLDIAALSFQNTENGNGSESEETLVEEKLFGIGTATSLVEGKFVNLAGTISEANSGEPIIGAVVLIEEPRIGVITNEYGYYNIVLPQGRHTLLIRSVGMEKTERQIMLYSEGNLDVELEEDVIALKEIIVEAEKSINITGIQMGIEKMGMAEMKQVPAVLGELDVGKVILTLPGVQSVGEGASGFNVRGGAADQNLVTLNNATIYNPTHFFGFFSAFNPDVIKSATLLKGGIPAQYGGRVSSMFDVRTRDGNKKDFGLRGGISPVTARLTFEGPIVPEKASILIGGRSTYSNWLLEQVPDADIKNSKAGFYDMNGKISLDLGDKDALSLSGYYSRDKFQLISDSLYQYKNLNASFEWRHNFSNKMIGVLTGSYSDYEFQVSQESDSTEAFETNYSLASANFKLDFTYFMSSKSVLDFGFNSTLYNLDPGKISPTSPESIIKSEILEPEKAIENALYIGDNITLSDRLSVYLGLRFSSYSFLGPKSVYEYQEGIPKSPGSTTGLVSYGSNEVIQSYYGPEYRISGRYILQNESSLKFGYNRMRQYIHMLTNTTAISPTDTWKLSDTHIRPQIGDQVSVGYFRNLKNNTIETYVEAYYKEVKDILEYKGGAQLLLNEQIETDLINGNSRSYGVEFLFKKKVGKLNGWISYTYSRSLIKVEGNSLEETINRGEYFPANYDKPNNLNIIANYKFNRRFSLSSSFVYSTGRPITYPVAKYNFGNGERIFYSDRNEFRVPDYIRVDLSLQLEGNHKVRKLAHSSWAFSVYNLFGRDNVYSIYFVSENGQVQGYKLSVFGSAIPTITYNFRL